MSYSVIRASYRVECTLLMSEHGSFRKTGRAAGELKVAHLVRHDFPHDLLEMAGVLTNARLDQIVVRLVRP